MRTDVNFSYAFGTPHRLCICMPEASYKTLMDCSADGISVQWTDENLSMPQFPLGAFKTPSNYWRFEIKTEQDGVKMSGKSWKRVQNRIPALDYEWSADQASVTMTAVSGPEADIYKLVAVNHGKKSTEIGVFGRVKTLCFNTIWMDPDSDLNAVTALPGDRSDRILVLAAGAPKPEKLRWPEGLEFVLKLKPGENRIAYIVRPHRAFLSQTETLLAKDWETEIEKGIRAWTDIMEKAPQFDLPDKMVADAYYACFLDIFVAREKMIDGRMAGTAGTQVYRAMNTVEPLYAAMLLDQAGMFQTSAEGVGSLLQFQLENGRWDDYGKWGENAFWIPAYRCWYLCEHYKYTGDTEYLLEGLKRMLAHARWAETKRAAMKPEFQEGEKPLTWGMMPRGMGDAGLMDDDDLYGVFIVSSVWHCYLLKLAVWAADELRLADISTEIKAYLKDAWECTLDAMERGAIVEEDGMRWIPGVPGKTSGSRFNATTPLYPCGLMKPNEPLIDGTIRYLGKHLSEGGLPLNLGWMKDGLWVAIAIDNLSYAHLARGEYDAAAKYLLPTINHGTPLYTWCEERSPEPGSVKITGDRQHTFTPLSVARFIRDSLVMEMNGVLNLACATERWWLEPGKSIKINASQTYWGKIDYSISRNETGDELAFTIKFHKNMPETFLLHFRLPEIDAVFAVTEQSGAICTWIDGTFNVKPKSKNIHMKISVKNPVKIAQKKVT